MPRRTLAPGGRPCRVNVLLDVIGAHRLEQRNRALTWAVLFGVPVLCIAVLIDRRRKWMDEATSVYVANRSLAGMAAILRHVNALFAFYYALLHAWLAFGSSTAYTRLLSALFAIATLPVIFVLTQRRPRRSAPQTR